MNRRKFKNSQKKELYFLRKSAIIYRGRNFFFHFKEGKKMNKEGREQYMRECKSFKMNARL